MQVVLLRPRAQDDLDDIWVYIAEDSEAHADRFIDRMGEQFQLLAGQPMLGRLRKDLRSELRSFPFGRYVIFYELIPDGVAIARVLHCARELGALFHSDHEEGD